MYDSPDQRIAALEARLTELERVVQLALPVLATLPQLEQAVTQQGVQLVRLIETFTAAAESRQADFAEQTGKIAAMAEAVEGVQEALQEIVDDANDGESWKRGPRPE